MNNRDALLLLGLFGIVAVLGYIAYDLHGQSKQCLASPLQYWIGLAEEETGKSVTLTINSEKQTPVIVTRDEIRPIDYDSLSIP